MPSPFDPPGTAMAFEEAHQLRRLASTIESAVDQVEVALHRLAWRSPEADAAMGRSRARTHAATELGSRLRWLATAREQGWS